MTTRSPAGAGHTGPSNPAGRAAAHARARCGSATPRARTPRSPRHRGRAARAARRARWLQVVGLGRRLGGERVDELQPGGRAYGLSCVRWIPPALEARLGSATARNSAHWTRLRFSLVYRQTGRAGQAPRFRLVYRTMSPSTCARTPATASLLLKNGLDAHEPEPCHPRECDQDQNSSTSYSSATNA